MTTTPRRIYWSAIRGIDIVLDEDGVNVQFPRIDKSFSLEEPELNSLLATIDEAKRCRDAGTAPTPQVPERTPWQAHMLEESSERVAKEVRAALSNEFDR